MIRGVVAWFDAVKGFGFVTCDDGRPDVFVHTTAIERSGLAELRKGDAVEIEVEENRGKMRVKTIELVHGATTRTGGAW